MANPVGMGLGVGAIVGGGLLNAFGDDPMKLQNDRLRMYHEQVLGRGTPQAGPAQQSALSGFRRNQDDLIGRLAALSRGEGPSLAAEQLRQATDRNVAGQASIAQSGRGNAALAGITAANNASRIGQQAAGDAAMARIGEQQMAFQQLGGAIGQARGQDESNGQFNALQQNYRDQFNIEAQLRARGMNDAAIQQILGMYQQGAMKPTFGDQLMAGGAGLLAMGATGGR